MTASVTSSVAVAVAELRTLLGATFAADDPPVTVLYGRRGTATQTGERVVVVGYEVKGTRQADGLGGEGQSFTERYSVGCIASVDLEGPDESTMQAATEAALALWRRSAAAVNTTPERQISAAATAAGVLKATASADFELVTQASAEGRTAAVRWVVDLIAQNT